MRGSFDDGCTNSFKLYAAQCVHEDVLKNNDNNYEQERGSLKRRGMEYNGTTMRQLRIVPY